MYWYWMHPENEKNASRFSPDFTVLLQHNIELEVK
jgi:hypothetical protein